MTDSTNVDDSPNPQNSIEGPAKMPLRKRLKRKVLRTADRRPAYRVTDKGIRMDYFDFSRPDTLPFDVETYHETQIFLGDYANPWYVDLDAIQENYDEFGAGDPIEDLISENHVIPSQKYKIFMNQGVLKDTFQAAGFDRNKMLYLMYAVLAVSAFNLLVMIT